MTYDRQLAYSSAADLINLIRSKQVSPVEVTELFLQRIDDIDHQLNSFLLVTHDIAIEQAKAAENAIMSGDDLGPLHGLPIPIKDNQMTGGIRTTSGSIIFKDHVPQNNAAFLDRILRDGGIILGKTNCSELGFVGTCENSLGITGKNPGTPSEPPAVPAVAQQQPSQHISHPSPLEVTVGAPSEFLQISAERTPSNQPSDVSLDTLATPVLQHPISSDNQAPSHEPSKTPQSCYRPWPASTAETRAQFDPRLPTS